MLKRRLIPKLQMRRSGTGNGSQMVLVTTVQYGQSMEIGDPVSQAKIFEAQAADELIFLDLDASTENREPAFEIVRIAAEEIFMPFTFGGGIGNLSDIRNALLNGADKVSINTAAVNNHDFINMASLKFGAQCIVLSIDYRVVGDKYEVWIKGGKELTDLNPVDWAVEGERRGAGEILLTSIDRDGKRSGLDLHLTSLVAESVSIPVITSGGCGAAQHFVDGFLLGKANAVSAGTYFCYKDENPMQTRSQIRNAGIPIRVHT